MIGSLHATSLRVVVRPWSVFSHRLGLLQLRHPERLEATSTGTVTKWMREAGLTKPDPTQSTRSYNMKTH